MSVTPEYLPQSTSTALLATELNGIAAGAFSTLGGAFNNVQGTANLNGYPYAELEVVLAAPSSSFAANSALNLWFVKSIDGTDYEDASTTTRPPDCAIPLRTDGVAQRTTITVKLPPGYFKGIAQNSQGSGAVALAASGNTVKILPFTVQGV